MKFPSSLLFSKLDKWKVPQRGIPSSLFISFVVFLWIDSRTFLAKFWIQWDNNLFSAFGGAVFDAPQDLVCLLATQDTLLNLAEPAADQQPQIPFCRASLQPLLSLFMLVPGVTLFQLQNPSSGLLIFQTIDGSPVLQTILIPI